MAKKLVVIFLLQLIVFVLPLLSQLPLSRNFTIKDGLPSNTVYKAFQNPKGYMYFLTSKGICRFDGAEFVKIQIDSVQSEDMPYGAMDSLGRLWAANLAGEVVCVEGLYSRIQKIIKTEPNEVVKEIKVRKNTLIFRFYNTKKSIFKTVHYDVNTLKPQVFEDYAVTGFFDGKLLGLNVEKDTLELVVEISKDSVIKGRVDRNKYSEFGIFYFPQVLLFSDFSYTKLPKPKISSYNIDLQKYYDFGVNSMYSLANNKILLISTNNRIGVYMVNMDNPSKTRPILLDVKINSVFIDKYKKLWLLSENSGVYVLPLTSIENANNIQEKNSVNCIFQSQNKILVGYENGFFGEIEKFNYTIKYTQLKELSGIQSITLFDEQVLMASTKRGECFLLNRNRVKKIHKNKFNIKCIYTLNNDFYMSLGTAVLKTNFYNEDSVKYLLPTRTYALSQRNDTLLLGTTKGLYGHYQDSTFPFKGFKQFELFIKKLYVDSSNVIWICTDGKGLVAYKDEKNIRYFGKEQGMSSLSCSDIVQLDKERYAVGTDKGLWIFSQQTGRHFKIDELDGLESNEITALTNDGEYLWIGTTKGLVKAALTALQPNSEVPYIEINKAETEHGGVFMPLTSEQTYQRNHILFHLSSCALLAGEKRNYTYRLLGLDSNWIATSEQKIEFLGLSPGVYTFEAKVYNEDGVECAKPASFIFTISPPWWRTIWFYGFLLTIVGGSVYYRFMQLKEKQAEELRLQEEKYKIQQQINNYHQQALQSQMNPHFIFNSLNAIQSFLSTNDEKNAMMYLSKFGRLIRQIFDQSKQKSISIEEEIDMLRNYLELEKLRFKNKVEINLWIDEKIENEERDIMLPPLLLQPIIENSFRHGLFHKGEGGILDIHFILNNNRLKCKIRDNGVGRERSKAINMWRQGHKSSGLSTTADRIRILDGGKGEMYMTVNDLYDENNQPTGTETIIQL